MPRRALLGLLFAMLLAAPGRTDEVLVDGIAAQVGSDIVLISEVMQMVAPNERRICKAASLRVAGMFVFGVRAEPEPSDRSFPHRHLIAPEV